MDCDPCASSVVDIELDKPMNSHVLVCYINIPACFFASYIVKCIYTLSSRKPKKNSLIVNHDARHRTKDPQRLDQNSK